MFFEMWKIVIFLALLVASIDAIPFEDCGSRYDLRQVEIEGCATAPCHMMINSNVNVTMMFYSTSPSLRLDNNVFFFVQNVEMDATVTQHSCQSSLRIQKSCLLSNAQLVQFQAEMTVNEEIPPFPGQLVWRIFNEKGSAVVCFKVTVVVGEEDLLQISQK